MKAYFNLKLKQFADVLIKACLLKHELLIRDLIITICHKSHLILRFDVKHVLHVKLKRVGPSGTDDSGSLVDFESSAGSVSNDEVMDIMVGVRVPGLKREDWCVWSSIQLHYSLHWKRTIDKIRGFIVHILNVDYYSLIVRIWNIIYWLMITDLSISWWN